MDQLTHLFIYTQYTLIITIIIHINVIHLQNYYY